MNPKSSEEGQTREVSAKVEERLAQMEGILTRAIKKLNEFEESTNERLMSLEENVRTLASPPRRPMEEDFDKFAGLTRLTPAMVLTLEAIRGLSERTSEWISVEDIARKTGRSVQTERGYLRLLARTGRVGRKPVYKQIGESRRVRKYVYKAK